MPAAPTTPEEMTANTTEGLLTAGLREEFKRSLPTAPSTQEPEETVTVDEALPVPEAEVETPDPDLLPLPTDEDDDDGADATAIVSPTEDEPVSTEGADADDYTERVEGWAERVIRNPNVLSNVPPKHHQPVFEAALTKAVAATQAVVQHELGAIHAQALAYAKQQEYTRGYETAKAELLTTAEMQDIEDLRKSSPDEYAEMVASDDPETTAKVARYIEWKRSGKAPATAPPPSPWAQAMGDLIQAEKVTPQEYQRLLATDQQSQTVYGFPRYTNDLQGLKNMQADVAALRRPAQPTRATAPSVSAAVKARQENAPRLKELPKPIVDGTAKSKATALPTDTSELIKLGLGFGKK